MSGSYNSPWTDELRAKVKHLWSDHSATQIAEALRAEGHPFTRNAIIGVLHRAKLTSQHKSEEHRSARADGQKRTRPARSSANHVRRPPSPKLEAAEIKLRCVEIVPRNLTLMDLEPGDCRYPYGDGPMTFCGHPKMAGFSYCVPHLHLCKRSEPVATQTQLISLARYVERGAA